MIKNLLSDFKIKLACRKTVEAVSRKLFLDEQQTHRADVCLVDNRRAREVTFLLLGLLGQDVTLVSVFSLNFPGASERESLLGARICLNFWHFCVI